MWLRAMQKCICSQSEIRGRAEFVPSVLGLSPSSGRLRRAFAWFVGGILLVSSHHIPSKRVCL